MGAISRLRFLRVARKGVLLFAITLSVAGCWVLIGESFTGYTQGPDGADSGGLDGGGAACAPPFLLANGVKYPPQAPGPRNVAPAEAGSELFDTDKSPECFDAGTGTPLPYCLVFASTFTIKNGAKLATFGPRPLVIVAERDLVIESGGILDLAGEESGGIAGPGDHKSGSAPSSGGGGGNAEPGEASCDAGRGGSSFPLSTDFGLLAGGHGGGIEPAHSEISCRRGGMGGGAVQLVSLCGKISIEGNINASGGGGGAASDGVDAGVCPEGFGGGAGGTVWIQAQNVVVGGDAWVDLAGGGGSGGGCRRSGSWQRGTPGNRAEPGDGGNCSPTMGGIGGAGGFGNNPPRAGGAGSSASDAKCGGGGGAHGRLVLQSDSINCANAMWHNGVCTQVPQLH